MDRCLYFLNGNHYNSSWHRTLCKKTWSCVHLTIKEKSFESYRTSCPLSPQQPLNTHTPINVGPAATCHISATSVLPLPHQLPFTCDRYAHSTPAPDLIESLYGINYLPKETKLCQYPGTPGREGRRKKPQVRDPKTRCLAFTLWFPPGNGWCIEKLGRSQRPVDRSIK